MRTVLIVVVALAALGCAPAREVPSCEATCAALAADGCEPEACVWNCWWTEETFARAEEHGHEPIGCADTLFAWRSCQHDATCDVRACYLEIVAHRECIRDSCAEDPTRWGCPRPREVGAGSETL